MADGPATAGEPGVLDHYRAGGDAPIAAGVYRVVGVDEESVTLLRVVEDGRRVNSGAVVTVGRDALESLEPADDPDTGLGRLRQIPGDLAGHPLVSAAGIVSVGAGGYLLATAGGDAAEGGLALVAAGAAVLWLLVR